MTKVRLANPCQNKEANAVVTPLRKAAAYEPRSGVTTGGGGRGTCPPPPQSAGNLFLFFLACHRGLWCTIGQNAQY